MIRCSKTVISKIQIFQFNLLLGHNKRRNHRLHDIIHKLHAQNQISLAYVRNFIWKLDQINPQLRTQLLVLYAFNCVVLSAEDFILKYILKYLFEQKWAHRIDEKHYWFQYVIVMIFQVENLVLVMLICFLDLYVFFVKFINRNLINLIEHLAIVVELHIWNLLWYYAVNQVWLILIMIVFKLIVAQCLNDFERLLRQIDIDRLPRLLCKAFNAAHFLWLLLLSNHIEL